MVPLLNATNLMAKKSNITVNITTIQEANITRSLINRICKTPSNLFQLVLRREKLEHLVTNVVVKRKCSIGKQKRCWMELQSGPK